MCVRINLQHFYNLNNQEFKQPTYISHLWTRNLDWKKAFSFLPATLTEIFQLRVCVCVCAKLRSEEKFEKHTLAYRPLLISNFPFCVLSQEMSFLLACFSPLCKISLSLIEFPYFKKKKKGKERKKESKFDLVFLN